MTDFATQNTKQNSAAALPVRKILSYALISSAALLLMSPMGWRAYLFIGGAYVPELYAIPAALFCVALGDNPISKSIYDTRTYIWAAFCAALMMLGFFIHGDISASYSDFRTLFAVGASYIIIGHSDMDNSRSHWIYFLIFSLVCNAVSLSVLPSNILIAKFSFPILCIVALVYLCAPRARYLSLALGFALGLYLTVSSFYRQNFLVIALCGAGMVLGILVARDRRGRPQLIPALVFLAAASVSSVFLPSLAARLSVFFRSNEARYIQIISKSRELFAALAGYGGSNTGDQIRVGYLSFIADNAGYFLLPGGLGQKVISGRWRSLWMDPSDIMVGSSLDGGHLFMAAHFGLILSICFVFWFIRKYLINLRKLTISELAFHGSLSIASFVSFIGSSPFSQMSFAIAFGMCLHFLHHYEGSRLIARPSNG